MRVRSRPAALQLCGKVLDKSGEAERMTKSELVVQLAQRYPQLVAKDAEYAVKIILDAMTQALLEGNRIEVFTDTPWYCEQPVREAVDFTHSDEEIMRHCEAVARSLPRFMPRAQWVAQMKARMAGRTHG